MILDLWEAIKESVQAKHREDLAIKVLKTVEDYVVLDEHAMLGEDKYLDSALEKLYGIEDDFAEEDYEEL